MNYIKPILFTLIVLIGAVIGYSYYTFDSQYAVNRALSAYKMRDYNRAEYYLSVLNKKKKETYFLYKGYLERGKGNLDFSTKLFKELLSLPTNSPFLEERNFNLNLNAYLQKDFSLLDSQLNQWESQKNSYFLFKGLSCYQKQNYQDAKEYFLKAKPSFFASKWMESDFNDYFNEGIMTYFLAHSLIESSEPYRARQEIEAYLTKTNSKEARFSYLMGLSYFREAETKTLDLAIPYYQIAFTHFKRLPLWETEFEPYKMEVRKYYEKLLTAVLNESSYEELGYFLEALHYLEVSVSNVSDLFLKHIRKEIASHDKDKLMSLARQTLAYCHNSSFKEKLSESLYFYIQNLIENHDIDSIAHIWPLYYQISAHPQEDKEALSRLILERIEYIVQSDDDKLTKSLAWIRFLTSLEFNPEYKALFLENLTLTIKKMWIKEAPKAWIFSKYLDNLIYQDQREVFHQKMIEVLESFKSEILPQDPSYKDLLKEAHQYFNPSLVNTL